MTFILANQRDSAADVEIAFARYRAYVAQNRSRFPRGAYELASAPWYFDFTDHRCPHDAWLESIVIHEPSSGDRHEIRSVRVEVRLLGAYHDGYIELVYPQVFRYELGLNEAVDGHRDWRYDEFRLSESGRLVHEIEWRGVREPGRWLIEASDIEYRWRATET